MKHLPKADRSLAREHFYFYCVKRITANSSTIFVPTKFGSDSSDSETEDHVERVEEGRMLQVIHEEHTAFMQRAQDYPDFFAERGCTSKRDETLAVFAWWKQEAHAFPNLRIVAATLFSVRMTSASVERLFSSAGLVRTAQRNRMGAELFDALIAYSYNDPSLRAKQRPPR
eukprot:m.45597 g.45597  ORF g.45597 m.45597 type:complete len:171 (-) comp47275_c0_seq1:96-608(-)